MVLASVSASVLHWFIANKYGNSFTAGGAGGVLLLVEILYIKKFEDGSFLDSFWVGSFGKSLYLIPFFVLFFMFGGTLAMCTVGAWFLKNPAPDLNMGHVLALSFGVSFGLNNGSLAVMKKAIFKSF